MRRCLAVCGLGRCGSSAVMDMLAEGGAPVVGEWPSYEPATAADQRLVDGHAVKILDLHRTNLRPEWVLWLDRDLHQQAVSGLRFVGVPPSRGRVRAFERLLERDRRACFRVLGPSRHVERISFEALIERPHETAERIAAFARIVLGVDLDVVAMAAAVHPRRPEALKTPWEHQIAGGPR